MALFTIKGLTEAVKSKAISGAKSFVNKNESLKAKNATVFKKPLPPELAKAAGSIMSPTPTTPAPQTYEQIAQQQVSALPGATFGTAQPASQQWNKMTIQDRLAQSGNLAQKGQIAKSISLFTKTLNPELKTLTDLGAAQKAKTEQAQAQKSAEADQKKAIQRRLRGSTPHLLHSRRSGNSPSPRRSEAPQG
jgi:hypothetical protein